MAVNKEFNTKRAGNRRGWPIARQRTRCDWLGFNPLRLIREGVQTGHTIRIKTGSAAIAIVSINQLLIPGLYILYPRFFEHCF
jgi:hypothetical protein